MFDLRVSIIFGQDLILEIYLCGTHVTFFLRRSGFDHGLGFFILV